jgi:hypothetical protein
MVEILPDKFIFKVLPGLVWVANIFKRDIDQGPSARPHGTGTTKV